MSTTLLALDTATPHLLVGLLYQGNYLESPHRETIRHTDVILPTIEALLRKANCPKKNIDAIVVGIGPGSFMGVRTAISVAQGLAYALNCPVIPVSSLSILAKTAFDLYHWTKIAVAWDARMDAAYIGFYDASAEKIMAVKEEALISRAAQSASVEKNTWCAVGNGWINSNDFIQSDFVLSPTAKALLQLGEKKYLNKEILLPVQLEANYIRQKVTFN